MLKRKIDKGIEDRREGITVYRDIGAYVTIRIVIHNVLLVVVPSRDLYVRNGCQLAFDISSRGRSIWTRDSRAVGDMSNTTR